MQKGQLEELRSELAVARAEKDAAKADYDKAQDEIREKYPDVFARYEAANEAVAEIEGRTRTAITDFWRKFPDEKTNIIMGFGVRCTDKVSYDPVVVRDWAKVYWDGLLVVDHQRFVSAVKAGLIPTPYKDSEGKTVSPLPFEAPNSITIKPEPTATIKSDLSAFLPKAEKEADAAQ